MAWAVSSTQLVFGSGLGMETGAEDGGPHRHHLAWHYVVLEVIQEEGSFLVSAPDILDQFPRRLFSEV